jgi:hypothetical protein
LIALAGQKSVVVPESRYSCQVNDGTPSGSVLTTQMLAHFLIPGPIASSAASSSGGPAYAPPERIAARIATRRNIPVPARI